MGCTLTVKGKDTLTFGEKMISSATVDVNTPTNSMAKSSAVAVTMCVSGKLFSPDGDNTDTLKLLQWSLVPAQNKDAYRDVTVEVITAGKTFRKIDLPNAFVVDYSEGYSDERGVGTFSMVIRQKADQVTQVKADGDKESGEQN